MTRALARIGLTFPHIRKPSYWAAVAAGSAITVGISLLIFGRLNPSAILIGIAAGGILGAAQFRPRHSAARLRRAAAAARSAAVRVETVADQLERASAQLRARARQVRRESDASAALGCIDDITSALQSADVAQAVCDALAFQGLRPDPTAVTPTHTPSPGEASNV
ncbi:hypothetical protein E4T66_18560 [Sinimarinibacterium sp. CAU 1509]|uniref:hypothetical protein n=1 Tax=Sinimarinibacterium sp. CAU 1509 TaxID=2562283 RepID=UPI0010ACB77F|nr:hypothetical protein [Sinimarinibacterium sp. CAU 1509]TJY57410.1 hypothetical protein E4T66_18560 [Sinimarinibacterium sp. CAU 1509]